MFRQLISLLLIIGLTWSVNATEKQKAPEWQLAKANGEHVALSDFRGQPLVLHFWATWCPYCKKLQPGIEALYQTHKADGLQVMAVSFREDPGAKPAALLKKRGISFETAVNGEQVAAQYSVKGTPATFVISHKGNIVFYTSDSDPDNPKLKAAVAKAVADAKRQQQKK